MAWHSRLWYALLLATLLSLGALFSILGYLIIHGIGAFNWNFLVKEPAAVGRGRRRHRPVLAGHGDSREYLLNCRHAARRGSRHVLVRTGR